MINPKTKFLAMSLSCAALAGLSLIATGCSGEEEAPVAVNTAPPPPPPPPPAPTVTPIEQLMAEMNIDPRVNLPEDKAPDNDVDRRAVLSFFDGFARGNDRTVASMLPETDKPQLQDLVKSGEWKNVTSRISAIDVQCGASPLGDKATLAVIEVKGAGDMFQPQLWTYNTQEETALFEAVPAPPGILDRLSGDWIAKWFEILEQEMALADKPDEEYQISQKDLDEDDAGDSSGPPPPPKGGLRAPNAPPVEAPGIPGGGDGPRGG